MRTLRTRLAAAALVLPLALAGCSNDKTQSPAANPGGGGSAAAGNPVKVMLIYDETGSGAAPELVDGANAGLARVNANGGINGRPLELTVCKTGNDPNTADNCARQAQSLGVAAVVGELTLQKGHEKILRRRRSRSSGRSPPAPTSRRSRSSRSTAAPRSRPRRWPTRLPRRASRRSAWPASRSTAAARSAASPTRASRRPTRRSSTTCRCRPAPRTWRRTSRPCSPTAPTPS
ncbi:ABC transporter substrate-binding protein [Dactylosporangium vinaceum]|nr:ABC transporter substrate-binding protein [Dactylosporangium vinaceum]